MKNITRRQLAALAASALALGAAWPAAAQDPWPARPIKLVVPYPAGGNADTTARALATALGERLGQQVIVENKPGGGGSIGAAAVAKAPPDGYTLLLDATAFTVNPALLPKLSYKPDDFAPISLLTRAPLLLVVPATSDIHSVQELVARAKAKPGKLTYASAGNGGAQHLTGELFKQQQAISMTHIPYRGGAPALTDLIGGQVDLMFSAVSASGPFVKGGKLRALAVTSNERVPTFPDVKTLGELGVRGLEVYEWNGLFAPAGTPKAIVERLERETRAAVTSPALAKRWADMGVQGVGSSAGDFARFVSAESSRWSNLIRAAGIKPE